MTHLATPRRAREPAVMKGEFCWGWTLTLKKTLPHFSMFLEMLFPGEMFFSTWCSNYIFFVVNVHATLCTYVCFLVTYAAYACSCSSIRLCLAKSWPNSAIQILKLEFSNSNPSNRMTGLVQPQKEARCEDAQEPGSYIYAWMLHFWIYNIYNIYGIYIYMYVYYI